MSNIYTSNDGVVRWMLNVDQGYEPVRMAGERNPGYAQMRTLTAELTLYGITMEEHAAVTALLYTMRTGGGRPDTTPAGAETGNRFTGLDFEG